MVKAKESGELMCEGKLLDLNFDFWDLKRSAKWLGLNSGCLAMHEDT